MKISISPVSGLLLLVPTKHSHLGKLLNFLPNHNVKLFTVVIWQFFTHGIHDENFDFPRFRFTVADADSVLAFQKDLNFPPNQNIKLFTVVIWRFFTYSSFAQSRFWEWVALPAVCQRTTGILDGSK